MAALSQSVAQTLCSLYLTLFALGAITTVSEWKQIHCPQRKKIFYMFTFPLFMFTYLPICIVSLFKDVQWQPIRHERCLSMAQICGSDSRTLLPAGRGRKAG